MKTIILILFLSIGVLAQFPNPIGCERFEVNIQGRLTGLDRESENLIRGRMMQIAFYNLDTGEVAYIPVDGFGHYASTAETCSYFTIRPYMSPKAMMRYPDATVIFDPFLEIGFLDGDLNSDFTMSLMQAVKQQTPRE